MSFDTEWLNTWAEHCCVKRCRGVVVLRHCGNEYCSKHWEEYCNAEQVQEADGADVVRMFRCVQVERSSDQARRQLENDVPMSLRAGLVDHRTAVDANRD